MRTRSLSAFYLFICSCIALLLLARENLALECKAKEEFSSQDQISIEKFYLAQKPEKAHLLLSQNGDLKIMAIQNDPSRLMFFQKLTPPHEQPYLYTMDMAKLFGDQNFTQNVNFRVAPKITDLFCVKESGYVEVMYISEAFRGNFTVAANDPVFLKNMSQFLQRINFYIKFMRVYREIPFLRQKHCDIRPESFMYRENGNVLSQDYANDQTIEEFDPVITNFHKTVSWSINCVNPAPDYTEPEEFDKNLNKTEDYSENVEVFSLSLVILYLETAILDKLVSQIESREVLDKKLEKLPPASNIVKMFLGETESLSKLSLSENFAAFPKIVENWNLKKPEFKKYTNKRFKLEIEWLAKGMKAYYEFILQNKLSDGKKIKNLVAVYEKFLDVLGTMVRKNSISIVYERPSIPSVIRDFLNYQEKISGFKYEVTLRDRVRRIVLV